MSDNIFTYILSLVSLAPLNKKNAVLHQILSYLFRPASVSASARLLKRMDATLLDKL